MFEDDYEEEAPPPAVEAERNQRRFLLTALGWLLFGAVFYALGSLSLGFAIVVVVAGAGSALAFAAYWGTRT